jgi:hypothetical protein
MKHRTSFIFVSLWLLGSFCLEAFSFIYSLGSIHIAVPRASAIGVGAWIGMVLRKRWGIVVLYVYVFKTFFISIQDVAYSDHRLYSLCVLIILIGITFLFSKYAKNIGESYG